MAEKAITIRVTDSPPNPVVVSRPGKRPMTEGNGQRFRSRSMEIRAVRLRWVTWSDVCNLLGDVISPDNPGRYSAEFSDRCGEDGPYIELTIPTPDGQHIVRHGDWIVRRPDGAFHPYTPNIFEATYEPMTTIGATEEADG
ncbi:MAG: hypothetical protein ACR2P5_06000 [Gammaproteobacteria bacterium]